LVAFSCKRRGLLRASCPSPFGPACGCSKSLPAILSARVAGCGGWSNRPPTWSITCFRKCRFGQDFGCQRIVQSSQLRQQYLPESSIMWFIRPIHQP
jgi:hypothetical protein